jgi:uncharacterized membrane protein
MTCNVVNNMRNVGLCNPQYTDYYYNPGGCTVYSKSLTINIIFLFMIFFDLHHLQHKKLKTQVQERAGLDKQ